MDPQFDGMIFQTHAAELDRRRRHPIPPFLVLDVRSPEEYRHGHIPGAVAGTGDLAGVFPGGRIEVVVAGGEPGDARVRMASLELLRLGAHRIVELSGGMSNWEAEGYPVELSGAQAA